MPSDRAARTPRSIWPRRGVRTATTLARHALAYTQELFRGNAVLGDVSWSQPDSPPVILAHGFLGTRGTMQPLTRRFRADGRVVFSYHHGLFQTRSLRASAEELRDHVMRLHDDLGVARFDVVGFSMGGLVALHAIKFLQLHQVVRRLVLLGTPVEGSWLGLGGVALFGGISPSVWQVVPGSAFLADLRAAPMAPHVAVRQIQGAQDVLCNLAGPVDGVRRTDDYIVLPGGHSSLVVSRPFYAKVREFLDLPDSQLQRSKPATLADGDPQRG